MDHLVNADHILVPETPMPNSLDNSLPNVITETPESRDSDASTFIEVSNSDEDFLRELCYFKPSSPKPILLKTAIPKSTKSAQFQASQGQGFSLRSRDPVHEANLNTQRLKEVYSNRHYVEMSTPPRKKVSFLRTVLEQRISCTPTPSSSSSNTSHMRRAKSTPSLYVKTPLAPIESPKKVPKSIINRKGNTVDSPKPSPASIRSRNRNLQTMNARPSRSILPEKTKAKLEHVYGMSFRELHQRIYKGFGLPPEVNPMPLHMRWD